MEGATEGTFNGTLSPEDLEALKTGTVQKITVHNPSNGIVADLIDLNTLEGATEGTFNGTLSPEDLEALKTGTVQKITVHNPSNGIVADLIESAVGKVGIRISSRKSWNNDE